MARSNPVRTPYTIQVPSPVRQISKPEHRTATAYVALPEAIPVERRRLAVKKLSGEIRRLCSENPETVVELSVRDLKAIVKEMQKGGK